MNKRSRIPVLCSTLCLMTSVLVGCGGSDDDSSKNTDKANTSSIAAPATATKQQTSSDSPPSNTTNLSVSQTPQDNTPDQPENLDTRPKLLAASMVEGTIAKEAKAGLPSGTTDNYDVMLIDQRDALDGTNETKIKAALKDYKQVVIDMGPAGEARKARETIIKKLFGMSIDADAVMVEQGPENKGYFLTPIDSAQKNINKTSSPSDSTTNVNDVSHLQTNEPAQANQNTVKAIFGL